MKTKISNCATLDGTVLVVTQQTTRDFLDKQEIKPLRVNIHNGRKYLTIKYDVTHVPVGMMYNIIYQTELVMSALTLCHNFNIIKRLMRVTGRSYDSYYDEFDVAYKQQLARLFAMIFESGIIVRNQF